MWLAAAMVMLALALGACGGSDTSTATTGGQSPSEGNAKQQGTLTVAVTAPTPTLDPALMNANPSYLWMAELAYDPLIWYEPDGSYKPGLATKWTYVADDNTRFELTLRSGVKFADGTPLDAEAVAASLRYAFKTGTSGPIRVPNFESVKATGPLTVLISCSSPCGTMPIMLSQSGLVGSIISPAGLRDKKKLGSRTFGAGPYVLNAAETVANDHYTYDANPTYWNRSAVHYKRVVVRIVSDPNARVSTLKSGQADIIDYVPPEVAKSVESSGMAILPEPAGTVHMIFRDRTGKRQAGDPPGAQYAPELANVLVRRALNYAVDRKTIVDALGHGYSTPTDEWTAKGAGAYDPALESMYTYDPEKAKALLRQAGYPNGFTLPVLTQKTNNSDQWALAIAQYWEKIGVKVKMTTAPDLNAYFSAAPKTPVLFSQYGAGSLPYSLEAVDWYGKGGIFNAYHTEPWISELVAKAAAAPPEEAKRLYLDINKRAMEQALNLAIAHLSYLFAYNPKSVNIPPFPKVTGAGQTANYAPILTRVTPR